MRHSSPCLARACWPSRAEHPLICRWPLHWPSGCSVGMRGMKPTPNSGFTTSTFLPVLPRLPKDRWRLFSLSSSSPLLLSCAASGKSFGALSGGRAWCSTLPWCCPGLLLCSIKIQHSSASSFSNTTCSASPPTAISTMNHFGTTLWLCSLASCLGPSSRFVPLSTAFSHPSRSGGSAVPGRENRCLRGQAMLFRSSWCCGRSFRLSSSPSRSPSCRATSFQHFRPSPFSLETTSIGAGSQDSTDGFSSDTPWCVAP